jgi:hypothetical protein
MIGEVFAHVLLDSLWVQQPVDVPLLRLQRHDELGGKGLGGNGLEPAPPHGMGRDEHPDQVDGALTGFADVGLFKIVRSLMSVFKAAGRDGALTGFADVGNF